MSDNNSPQGQQPPQEPQGKLVLGKDAKPQPENARRTPYQYQGTPPGQQAPANTPQQPQNYPVQKQNYPVQQGNQGQHQNYPVQQSNQGQPQNYPAQQSNQAHQGYQQNYPAQQGNQAYPGQQQNYQRQNVQANPVPSPYSPPAGQQRPFVSAPQSLQKPKRRRAGCAIGCLSVLLVLLIVGIFAVGAVQHVLAFGSAISTQKNALSTQTNYMNTSDRTNILIMGYGGGDHDGAYLTDSMSLVSLLPDSHHTSLISVPRDLYVQYPPSSGQYMKINAVYESAAGYTNTNPQAGGDAAAAKIQLVTGLNVKYWVTIDFTGFRKLIDALGGIDVYVPDSFNACYPVNDDASVNASWKIIQFNKGMQHMNGEQAIEYARAREPLNVCSNKQSENLAELTDFGRSARQQIIVKAVLSDVKQVSTWPKLYNGLDALQSTIYTNMSFADLSEFAMKMNLNDPKTAHIGLSNQNVLVDSSTPDGSYILSPANNDWSQIPVYIKQHLYN